MTRLLADLAALRPRRRWPWAAAAGAGLVAAAGAAVALARPTPTRPSPCPAASARLAGNLGRRLVETPCARHLAAAWTRRSGAQPLRPALAARLDALRQPLVDHARRQPVARRASPATQSDSMMDLRMRCLDRRRSELAAVVDLAAGAKDAAGVDRRGDRGGRAHAGGRVRRHRVAGQAAAAAGRARGPRPRRRAGRRGRRDPPGASWPGSSTAWSSARPPPWPTRARSTTRRPSPTRWMRWLWCS